VPTHGEGIDIYKNHNYKRNYMINKFQYQFIFEEDEKEEFEEVRVFLSRNNASGAICPA
jgi:hypothetical protein